MKYPYHRLENRKILILPLEKYFKILKNMIIGTFKVGEIMVLKHGHLMLPGAFPDKVTPGIGFTDKDVVPCDVSVVKIILQVLVIYK